MGLGPLGPLQQPLGPLLGTVYPAHEPLRLLHRNMLLAPAEEATDAVPEGVTEAHSDECNLPDRIVEHSAQE